MPHVRLLPLEALSGPNNMALDETLLHAAERGTASLRFYTWSEPTLSLGYFQPSAVRSSDARLANVAWVRRPSGGGAIMHHHELTYCLTLPAGPQWQSKESWLCRFHHLISSALESFAVKSRSVLCGEQKKLGEVLCFLDQTPGDLLIDWSKVAGSAQRKLRGALMQHGSILLEQSPFAPALLGIRELAGKQISPEDLAARLAVAFQHDTQWEIEAETPTDQEKQEALQIAREKYGAAAWNAKR
jgi:lipoate-protein ligase A